MRNHQGLQSARRLFFGQLMVILLAMGIFGINDGLMGVRSALLSGLSCLIPCVCFSVVLFWDTARYTAGRTVRRFYRGEALKLGLSVLCFALIFIFVSINPWVFFMTYLMTQVIGWVFVWLQ